ncbi:MAG TPA: hypothetical protein VL576_02195 [Candidatus Paceibacterota bacterium]|jgi:hypothetical protein|nr:hypothetical protein [Candidatus Paceibacterota bacterium]
MKNIITQLGIGILVSIAGTFASLSIASLYNKQDVTWNTDRCVYSDTLVADCYYYKVPGYSIGQIYILNSGSTIAKNVRVILNDNIPPENVMVIDTPATIKIENSKTVITAESLQPDGGDLDIAFKTVTDSDTYGIYNLSTDSGPISPFDASGPWWQFSTARKIFVLTVSICSLLIGFFIARRGLNREV